MAKKILILFLRKEKKYMRGDKIFEPILGFLILRGDPLDPLENLVPPKKNHQYALGNKVKGTI